MILLAVSFIAGVLTILAPCVLPILPVVLGVTASKSYPRSAYIVLVSLCISVILFTLLLKASLFFIAVPATTWNFLAGSIIVLFGATLLFPSLSTSVMKQLPYATFSPSLQHRLFTRSYAGDMVIGASLGLIFASCSPIYFFILATILPSSFFMGTLALAAYVAGLALMLLLVALLGGRVLSGLRSFTDPEGTGRRIVGAFLIVLGILVITGVEKKIERHLLEKSVFDLSRLEYKLLNLIPN